MQTVFTILKIQKYKNTNKKYNIFVFIVVSHQMQNSQPAAANAELIPESTHATRALDKSEQEYNRMISQQMTYHKSMMDDLMKLSSESGSDINRMNIVSGLGTTVSNVNATNEQLVNTASKYADQSKQSSATASKLNAYTKMTASKLNDDIKAYNALKNQEGFANAKTNPSMDAALEMSEIMNESQKYALVIFGLFSIFLLYKTVKHL